MNVSHEIIMFRWFKVWLQHSDLINNYTILSQDYQKTRNNTSESALQNPLHQQRMYQQPSTSRGLFSTLGQKNTTEKNEANGNKTNYTTYDSFEVTNNN